VVHRGLDSSEVPTAGFRAHLGWILGRLRRFRIDGDSMRPVLLPGVEVLVDRDAYRAAPPAPGDIVAAHHPYRRDVTIVKRVEAIEPDGSCRLTGDNPEASTDSRCFGVVRADRVLGRVSHRFDRD